MEQKTEVAIFIGGGVLVIGALLYVAMQGSGGTSPVQGVFTSAPSDAAVSAIETAQAQDFAASTQASTQRSTNALQALLGLATLQEQQTVAGENDAATTQQLQISTGAQTSQDTINANATVSADSILAQANEIISSYTNQTSQFVASEQEKAAEAADQANEATAQITTSATSAQLKNELDAQQNEVSLTKNLATTQSNNGLISSIVSGLANVGAFFSNPGQVIGVPTSGSSSGGSSSGSSSSSGNDFVLAADPTVPAINTTSLPALTFPTLSGVPTSSVIA